MLNSTCSLTVVLGLKCEPRACWVRDPFEHHHSFQFPVDFKSSIRYPLYSIVFNVMCYANSCYLVAETSPRRGWNSLPTLRKTKKKALYWRHDEPPRPQPLEWLLIVLDKATHSPDWPWFSCRRVLPHLALNELFLKSCLGFAHNVLLVAKPLPGQLTGTWSLLRTQWWNQKEMLFMWVFLGFMFDWFLPPLPLPLSPSL